VEGSSAWFSCFVGALALLAIGYFAWRTYGGGGASPPQAGPSPVAVVVATATARVWQTLVSAVGTLVAVQRVEVTSKVPGMVSAIHFQSGESVRAGALLLELDATADRARLASLVAQFEQARADDTRNRRLVERGLISTAEAEQSATTVETLATQVQEQRTLINKKRIEAPFAGELGIRLVNLGQFIAAGQPIMPLQSIAPIYVNFALPEARYPAIRSRPRRLATARRAMPCSSSSSRQPLPRLGDQQSLRRPPPTCQRSDARWCRSANGAAMTWPSSPGLPPASALSRPGK
jgi:multidrug efflux pump subunit AcrA (membrane-fusion protein)